MSPLIKLYGEDAINLAVKEIEYLKVNSNIPFDSKYVSLGISFMIFKAEEILEGIRPSLSLKDLVSSSFGEAAIYKYNVKYGILQFDC